MGTHTPAVVFLPGGGAIGRDYWNLHRRTSELTTSVLYDRAGTGDGPPATLPRTSAQATDELRALLRARGVPAPYLLVGHSLGGLYARHYATRFPAEVAALLLLDPAHEDYAAAMPEGLRLRRTGFDPAGTAAAFDEVPAPVAAFYRDLYEQALTGWPAEVRDPLIDHHVSTRGLKAGLLEASNLDVLHAEIRAAGPLPDVPLLILSSSEVDAFKRAVSAGVPEELLAEEVEAKHALYARLAASVARGEVRRIPGGHATLHLRGEQAVMEAIEDLLRG